MAMDNKFSEMVENRFYYSAYQRYLTEGKLVGSKCKKCGHISVPPTPICSECHGRDMEIIELKGKGKLAAYTVVGVGAPLMVEEGFDREHQYCSGVVELEEGPRVTARILGVDVTKPEQIKIGTPVAVDYVKAHHSADQVHEEGTRTFLAFRALS